MNILKNKEVKNAILLGLMCTISYLGCYVSRSILSVVSPQMLETSMFSVEYIGGLSTGYMILYAVGQLINGRIGDLIKTKYLVGGGLFFAGLCNILIPLTGSLTAITVIYSLSGFFLSMIYAPIMKAVAENTLPVYATRCSLGFTFASFFGTPLAAVIAVFFNWENVFILGGIALMLLGILCFISFIIFEKKGIVKYKDKKKANKEKIDIHILLENSIIKYSIISFLTGIIRTSVLFWIPTYLSQCLKLSEGMSATAFTIITLIKSASPFINVLLIYDFFMKRNANKSIFVMFFLSTASFAMMYFVHNPIVNIVFLTLALLTSAGASSMVFSVYCPSLRETGMVSTVTGFLDAVSYVSAAIANLLFANAISTIGWDFLILTWSALMLVGIMTVIPIKKNKNN